MLDIIAYYPLKTYIWCHNKFVFDKLINKLTFNMILLVLSFNFKFLYEKHY